MHRYNPLVICVLAVFVTTLASAQGSKDDRIRQAVKNIINTQFESGEQSAIEQLQNCYKAIPLRAIDKLEECVAQDIAYANLSAGMYKGPLKSLKQPEYTTMEALKPRVYSASIATGLTEDQADRFLRQVAPIAIASLDPAIKNRKVPTQPSNPSSFTDFTIREAGVSFQLSSVWQGKIEETKLPTGQLMQRWVREPIKVTGGEAMPGMIALATPVAPDANLALVTQQVLARDPYKKKLVAETECVKCMKYKLRMPDGTATTIAPDSSSACGTFVKSGRVADCSAESVNFVGLKLEPSWVHRFEKETPTGTMKVVLVHAIVGGKLLDITFWYPPETAGQVEDEIAQIISSMRDR